MKGSNDNLGHPRHMWRLRRGGVALLAASAVALAIAGCGTLGNEPVPEGSYRVEKGDTLYTIARRNKTTVGNLVRWNGLPSQDRIEVGQVLRVKPPGGAAGTGATASGPVTVAETPRVDNSAPAALPTTPLKLQWPADGKVTGRFGPPADKGLRIAVAANGTVRAAAAGRAIHVGNLRGYGMLVILKHSDDWLTVYGNLDQPLVSEGDTVAAGQPVGRMGAASELHFEVRGNGKPVDPAGYLPTRG